MDARELIELLRTPDALPDAAVLRAAADRLERQHMEFLSQARQLLDQARELSMAEAYRMHLEARNRELLARCDLLSWELQQVGRKNPMRRRRSGDHASSSAGVKPAMETAHLDSGPQ